MPYRPTHADPSSALAEQLLGPDLPAPPEVDALYNFMTSPPAAPIPVCGKLPSAPHEHFTAAKGDLASAFNHSLSGPLAQGVTEMFTVIIENTVVVTLLVALDVALPDKSCIGKMGRGGTGRDVPKQGQGRTEAGAGRVELGCCR